VTATPGGALLVAGTASDAGKTVVTAGICRWLAREGIKVAPFKAQNMSLNSMVTCDGAEIGRAQAMQAAAAGVEPEAAMNPVLLKPGSDRSSQVVLCGRPIGEADAMSYRDLKPRLLDAVLACLADLRSRFDVVAGLPVLVVGDIDRGGVFASLFGTLALLAPADQRLISGFMINKFRGDPALLAPGLDMITGLTGRPVLGVLPWSAGLWLDVEDSLDLTAPGAGLGSDAPPVGAEGLTVAVIRLPRLSNVTDADALAAEPGVRVRFTDRPDDVAAADLAVLPGTRATVNDLAWLRATGLADVLARRAEQGRPTIGICGGYQMLATTIDDPVESGAGRVEGLGLLPARVRFAAGKTLGIPRGSALGHPVRGYEIHHGVVTVDGGEPFLDGTSVPGVWGTTWHGIFENDEFRRAFLTRVAAQTGRRFEVAAATDFAAVRQRRLDALGDLVADHLDTAAVWRLIEDGPTHGLPIIAPGAPE
jgi:adenosylcobyric acid synthase